MLKHLINAVKCKGIGVVVKYPIIIISLHGAKKVFEWEHGIRVLRTLIKQKEIIT